MLQEFGAQELHRSARYMLHAVAVEFPKSHVAHDVLFDHHCHVAARRLRALRKVDLATALHTFRAAFHTLAEGVASLSTFCSVGMALAILPELRVGAQACTPYFGIG